MSSAKWQPFCSGEDELNLKIKTGKAHPTLTLNMYINAPNT